MKKILSMLLIIIILVFPLSSFAQEESKTITQGTSGDSVVIVQERLRELGYLHYRATGKFNDMSILAVKNFQTQNGIAPDGQIGEDTYTALFSTDAKRAPINPTIKKISGPAYNGKLKTAGELSSWESISKILPIGTTVSVQDYNTALTYNIQRIGGEKSAQVVCVTANDYDAYKKTFGGGDTWEHRPVLVTIDNKVYAASIFGNPTHTQSYNESGMQGSTTLYFNNSKSDLHALSDEEHILSVMKAGKK
ncbi:MAG: peptidoglycan-binding domain-containing protein [Christensenellaceae bacterium]